ncbi:hypothetical protein PM082_022990 [Marasmius tenuissimus]|nr:hypothetical protein PM082_022969 [Marasmius tenuissimus]KAJ8095661.1 hypothetical protein PM082_022986 [Marasmius tenuissimus]KAJ8095665.1 hypothetical protein PM082_022990 [Marasmius tenuissimus]
MRPSTPYPHENSSVPSPKKFRESEHHPGTHRHVSCSSENYNSENCNSKTEQLHSCTGLLIYIAYLAHILCARTEQEDRIRTIAGYLLENNNARLILSSSPEAAHCVRAAVLRALDDQSVMIRNAASQYVVAFTGVGVLAPRDWPVEDDYLDDDEFADEMSTEWMSTEWMSTEWMSTEWNSRKCAAAALESGRPTVEGFIVTRKGLADEFSNNEGVIQAI